MSITVQAMMLKLVGRIDPQGINTGNNNIPEAYTLSTVGVYDGVRFNKQRQVDIYNEARYELLRALQFTLPKEKLTILAEGPAKLFQSAGASSGSVNLPSDYFALESVVHSTSTIEVCVVPRTYYSTIKRGRNPYRTESATLIFLMPEGRALTSPNGGTNFQNGQTLNIQYLSLASFVLSDVTGGSTVETIDDTWMTSLLEIAEAISLEYGREELNKVIQVQTAGLQ